MRRRVGAMVGYARFVNLLIGRIGELSFRMKFQQRFVKIGYELQDRSRGYKRGDLSLLRNTKRLCDLNIKIASERFDSCEEKGVLLQPNDCIPISLYKLLPARKKWPLIFAFHKEFDFNKRLQQKLEEKIELREEIDNLYLSPKVNFEDEDRLIDYIIQRIRSDISLLENPGEASWKVISQHKSIQITKANIVSRYYQALTTQGNMHFSYVNELTDIDVFINSILKCQSPKDVVYVLQKLNI